MADVLAYFITFTCYGNRLHGDGPYAVDREHRTVDGPYLAPDRERFRASAESMVQEPYALDAVRRRLVLAALREVCQNRNWLLLAAHVRSTHVHVVVQATERSPERVMTALKAHASRVLNQAGVDPEDRRRWTRHGSTRYVNSQQGLLDTMQYVQDDQGEPMELWVNEEVTLIL